MKIWRFGQCQFKPPSVLSLAKAKTPFSASNYLFDILKDYGGDFPPDFWDILWRQLLYPIFMVLKSKSEMKNVLNHEDLSVWLSTTMIQALRNMITLFTHYFESLEYMLDRFLDLLTLCICQENDTIARIGSNCLQQLILQNVTRFQPEHWSKIVGNFVQLFERTTAYQLFSAATTSSDSSGIADDDSIRRSSVVEVPTVKDLNLTNSPTNSTFASAGSEATKMGKASLASNENDEAKATLADQTTRSRMGSTRTNISPPPTPSAANAELEDYRPQSGLQQQPIVVTAARRKFFNKIITRCILQLLMIETVNELFSNDAVYTQIPSSELLRLMSLLKSSYTFAKRFNNNKDLRMRLWREGFMKQPPNLLKQESGSAACYINILLRMYHDEGEERRSSRAETEAALIPYVMLSPAVSIHTNPFFVVSAPTSSAPSSYSTRPNHATLKPGALLWSTSWKATPTLLARILKDMSKPFTL